MATWHIPLRCSGDRPPYFLYLIRTIIRIIRTVPTLWEIFHSHRSYVEAIGYHISRNALLQCLRVKMRFKGELHVTVVEAQVCFSVGSCLLSCLVYFQWSAHGPRLVARAPTHTQAHVVAHSVAKASRVVLHGCMPHATSMVASSALYIPAVLWACQDLHNTAKPSQAIDKISAKYMWHTTYNVHVATTYSVHVSGVQHEGAPLPLRSSVEVRRPLGAQQCDL